MTYLTPTFSRKSGRRAFDGFSRSHVINVSFVRSTVSFMREKSYLKTKYRIGAGGSICVKREPPSLFAITRVDCSCKFIFLFHSTDQLHTKDNIHSLKLIRARTPGELSKAASGFERGSQNVICSDWGVRFCIRFTGWSGCRRGWWTLRISRNCSLNRGSS